jgi:hypothetical protein
MGHPPAQAGLTVWRRRSDGAGRAALVEHFGINL